MKIKIITVGGTIDKIYFDAKSKYEIGKPTVAKILKDANVTIEYDMESLLYKDSLKMKDEDRELIFKKIEKEPYSHILITHGTDTMIETAKKLKTIKGKVIVLTGSISPTIFKKSDAPFNVGCALGALQSLPEGVYVTINGIVFDPQKVVKNLDLNRFESVSSSSYK